jgi:hypothetical protein
LCHSLAAVNEKFLFLCLKFMTEVPITKDR